MRYILLLATPDVILSELSRRLDKEFQISWQSPANLVLRSGGHIGWLDDEGCMTDPVTSPWTYLPEELRPLGIATPHVFVLRYSGKGSYQEYLEFLRRSLLLLADDQRIWIDDDYTEPTFVRGPEVIARIRREPEWNLGIPSPDPPR